MHLTDIKEFIKDISSKEIWVFQIIFCMIAPSFLFIILFSYEIFISIDLIKLLLLVFIFNTILFAFLLFFTPKEYIDIRRDLKRQTEIRNNMANKLESFKIDMLESENNSIKLINKNSKKNIKPKYLKNIKKENKRRIILRINKEIELIEYKHNHNKAEDKLLEQMLLIKIVNNIFFNTLSLCIFTIIVIISKYVFGINLSNLTYIIIILLLILFIITVQGIYFDSTKPKSSDENTN